MNEQEENNLEAVVDAVQAALDRNHYRKAGELIRAYAASLAAAQKERDAQIAEDYAELVNDYSPNERAFIERYGADTVAAAIRAQS